MAWNEQCNYSKTQLVIFLLALKVNLGIWELDLPHEDQPLSGYVGFDDLFDRDLVEASEMSASGVVGRIAVKNLSDSFSVCLTGSSGWCKTKSNR